MAPFTHPGPLAVLIGRAFRVTPLRRAIQAFRLTVPVLRQKSGFGFRGAGDPGGQAPLFMALS